MYLWMLLMTKIPHILSLILFMIIATAVIAQKSTDRLLFVDEAENNPSLYQFREELITAIERRDSTFLVSHIHESIQLYPSEEALIERMKKYYTPEEIEWGGEPNLDTVHDYLQQAKLTPSTREDFIQRHLSNVPLELKNGYATVWDDLGRILSLGGYFTDESMATFQAPYTWAKWPEDSDFQIAIVSNSALVYDRNVGDSSSTVIDTLSYDLVYRRGFRDRNSRVQIETNTGLKGFVDVDDTYGRWDLGIEISNIEGYWYITKYAWSSDCFN
jgi:hypothetical protein